jgi:hypothetical protein
MSSTASALRQHRLAAATALATLLAVGAMSVAHADPHRAAHKARPHGDYTRHSEVQRTEHGHTRTDTWTGEAGRTTTRQAEVVNDRATQTRTRDVEWTGPRGQQATRTDVTQRTANGYTRDTTVVGPKGGTTTRDVTASRDPASHTWVKDVQVEHTPPPRKH